MNKPKRQVFVSSLLGRINAQRKMTLEPTLSRANKERLLVLRKMLRLGKRIILATGKDISPNDQKLIQALKKEKGRLRIVSFSEKGPYLEKWMRDSFIKLGQKRILNSTKVSDLRFRTKKEARIFGDGGRLIDCGLVNNKPTLLVSNANPDTQQNPTIKKIINEEIEMLQKRGYTVYALPGGMYRPKGQSQGVLAREHFFHHIDVFVNHIKGTNILLVDGEYYSKNSSIFNKMKGFRIIKIPEKEKYFYPSNFLNIGEKEILMEKRAKETAKLLEKEGIRVYTTPTSLTGNLENFGGVRCFVNEV